MRALVTALAAAGETGEPLPPVFQQFVEHDVHIRRGQLTLIASGPGGGKSVTALTIAVRAQVPTLIISPDSDAYTSFTRTASMLTGQPLVSVEAKIQGGEGAEYERLVDENLGHIRWEFDQAPSLPEISEATTAFAHLYGEWPALIVVDNLSNIFAEGDNEYTVLKHTTELLKVLAAESGAAVVALHHLTGEFESSERPAPIDKLIGKVAKPATLVLTLFLGAYGDIGVCVVKNRFGKADPRALFRFYLATDLSRMSLS